MKFRTILGGIVALPLLYAAAHANDSAPAKPGIALPGVFLPLPNVFKRDHAAPEEPVRIAQAGDPRVTALEEEIRRLSGTIEELNFQILQMQEQMRKMQEDNEFRFQELEGKRSDAGAGRSDRATAAAPRIDGADPAAGAGAAASAPAGQATGGAVTGAPAESRDPALGGQSQTFGTITFDQSGNVTGGSIGDQATISGGLPAVSEPLDAPAQPSAAADGTTVAALPSTDDPEELYRNSYQFILSGDYRTAEAGFRDHIARFPGDQKAPDAHFWLGEAQLGQKKYRDAAETFLTASKDFPKSRKAPEMLLKLGVSLAALNQRDVACATFGEVGKRYPETSAVLKERVKQEQALAAC